ncbi:MAG TPA: hypothetical protein VMX13_01665 [Sedimentisphaerales bacterium]|nr:hypothetical protein [Sedimentisphaerales bacterium]
MRDIYRNPTLYYILVPVVVAVWPLLVWGVYLPNADDKWDDDSKQYTEALKTIEKILELDEGRLEFADSQKTAEQFEYAIAVDRVTRSCGISSKDYELSSKPIRTSRGQKIQSCHVVLKQVDITSLARFLSTLQLRWPKLQCEILKLTKIKGLRDAWKVDLDFTYYYQKT